MKWNFNFHARDKDHARTIIQSQSDCPVTDVVRQVVEALPADGPLAVSCHGAFNDASGSVSISVRLPREPSQPPQGESS